MKTQSIIHDIALCWKNNNKDVRPYAKFDEYFLAPYRNSDFYNHIHIFYDSKTLKPGYSIKINNKTYSFTFHQTYHDAGENSYYSIGLILPFVMLMDFRIDYKIFKQ